MKRLLYNSIAWVFLCTLFISCNEDNRELDKGNTPLELTATPEEVILNQGNDSSDAVTFDWTTGSNYGTGASIEYVFEIDEQGNSFKNAASYEMGKTNYQKKFSVQELNELLLNKLGIPEGEKVVLEARIIATVNEAGVETQMATTTIQVTSYKPVSTTLYLLGTATPGGNDLSQADPMSPSASASYIFTWQGTLREGNYTFITTLGEAIPAYQKGEKENTLELRNALTEPEKPFTIEEEGLYRITVDLVNLTVSTIPLEGPPHSDIYIIGDVIPSGWNIENAPRFENDPWDLFVFQYNEVLSTGHFKLPVSRSQGYTCDYYMPLVETAGIEETGVQLIPQGEPEHMWQITNEGPYKIKLDLRDMQINIVPFEPYDKLWIIGDATPNGWNDGDPNPMTRDSNDPYVFTYEGPLTNGDFKIPTAIGTDWNCDYFTPAENGEGINSTKMVFIPNAEDNPDYRWKITQSGNYRITINQLYETILIELL